MSSALLDSSPSLLAEVRRAHPAGGRGATLEELLHDTWRVVQTDGRAECPVCRAGMGVEGAAARCSGCGSTLA